MDQQEIAKVLSRALTGIIQALIALMGVKNTVEMVLDPIRKVMVDEQRGPTDAELDTVLAAIQSNSDIIQGGGG